ncbi:Glyoxalase/Bleomycin resistance protein/Dihydroxybiphenyl dioxygenase [Corynascus novoguineensis]|uniref:Glyoxalase/Bleomycin resistance protein/Dihydroxybiphenyl dioxygenase n=1 Tax=Corynascus novoguineensis TaxID=1126955 RepID=A0AAN7CR72_9PEZI|nr:Glyoxalase/Bleomycin resistance protein/Dihydroxybiphenyl dioxygenase [Corynascus novoguineensis]
MTIAHTGIRVPAARYAAVVTWYEAALAPLGYKRAMTFVDDQVVGFADATGIADWWVSSAAVPSPGDALAGAGPGGDVASVLPTHICFVAKDRASVDAFHNAAVAAGGQCNGKPGIRPDCSATYYAAFVLDPAGNNIEALCTAAE